MVPGGSKRLDEDQQTETQTRQDKGPDNALAWQWYITDACGLALHLKVQGCSSGVLLDPALLLSHKVEQQPTQHSIKLGWCASFLRE